MIIRGTTPTHTFEIPFDTSLVKEAHVIYGQEGKEIFRKDAYDCQMEGNKISVTLEQEDTLLLDCRKNVQIQLRVLTTDGTALASTLIHQIVHKCLNDEVIL